MTKVLVTGGAGYIGSVVVDYLMQNREYEIAIVDNLSTGHRDSVHPKAKFFEVDLTDFAELSNAVYSFNPEIVVHFAGVSQVGESNKDPAKYYRNNVLGGVCLLKSMLGSGCKKIVFSSTAAVYGEPMEIPITEAHGLAPISVYGESKALFEKALEFYGAAHGFKSLALRYFNAGGACESGKYGEIHEPESHLIPNVLKAAKKGGEFRMFGDDYGTKDGTCVRDYIHVEDLAEAHALGMEYLLNGGKSDFVNLGTGSGYSVREIVGICKSVTGVDFKVKVEPRRPGDPEVLVASNEKAKKLLQWEPRKGVKEIVESAWEFEKRN